MSKRELSILGTIYNVEIDVDVCNDEKLEETDGYCDYSTKKIVVAAICDKDKMSIDNLEYYKRKLLRHEITHAFLHESGLEESYSSDEILVDWIALQFPKMAKVFEEVGCNERH